MDPNATLATLREVMPKLRKWEERPDWTQSSAALAQHDSDLREATEAFDALDEWLTRDGFLPDDWESSDSQMGSRR